MLIIWDIHITSKYIDKIIGSLRSYIDSFSDQKNIVFLWDYVYHFSYDRKALLWLFDFFVELYKSGKSVYVLAWNHDWITESFVFAEGQKIMEMLWTGNSKWYGISESMVTGSWGQLDDMASKLDMKKSSTDNPWIYFITQPIIHEIEWVDILFVPHNLDVEDVLIDIKDTKLNLLIQELMNSKNRNENISWRLNKLLYKYISEYTDKKLIVMHHHYFANSVFTWQRARFHYKDIAFSDLFFEDYKNIYFVSWHLHQWFVYKNYFCVWSIWHSSPLEINQFKFCFQFDPVNMKAKWTNLNINPYFEIDRKYRKSDNDDIVIQHHNQSSLTEDDLKKVLIRLYQEDIWFFESEIFDVKFDDMVMPWVSDMSLYIKVDSIDYDNIDNIIDKDLRIRLKDIKLKKDSPKIEELMYMMDVSSKDLKNSISDWKQLLESYLKQRFWDESEKYTEKLKKMKLL